MNTEVIELGPECTVREGCLSLSSVADFVKRAEWVRVKCLDEGGHLREGGTPTVRVAWIGEQTRFETLAEDDLRRNPPAEPERRRGRYGRGRREVTE